jgi:thiosulfate/3-mercaptopyruvate sulfurtransferase
MQLDASKIRSRDAMLSNATSRAELVVDARSAGRFVGTEPEPRPGLKVGC